MYCGLNLLLCITLKEITTHIFEIEAFKSYSLIVHFTIISDYFTSMYIANYVTFSVNIVLLGKENLLCFRCASNYLI